MKETICAVIFDWAGTTVDYGCFAPLNALVGAFREFGVEITHNEARKDMGLGKREHVRSILSAERISKLWEIGHGRKISRNDADDIYKKFEFILAENLPKHTDPLPGVIYSCEFLRAHCVKIGSSTGYTKEMMKTVSEGAGQKGYAPDCVVTPDDVGFGRPFPYMIFENMRRFGVLSPESVIKVGDTAADIEEGVNAGVCSIGVIEGSSTAGLCREEYDGLIESEKKKIRDRSEQTFREAGADYVIRDMSDLPDLIRKRRLL
jgi:phosphonoacetaldehyde hydrolase